MVAVRRGRRQAFALAYSMALGSVWFVFSTLARGPDVYWMLPLLGFCTCGIFGVIIVYLPELYPTRLRTTGTGFCYNIARYLTASGSPRSGQADLALWRPWLRHADPPRGHEHGARFTWSAWPSFPSRLRPRDSRCRNDLRRRHLRG